ncbi:20329_t:CDS:2 [Funneliformis geosporum]|uniref:1195_t:CDS:1 n=1 Tax=Funneliformis geosporum TaxID=1117311 RepID=A0A9W4WID7_9GLOM|nr:1195_t:CDS:2 [Funneliformis geosporum]CAI2164034.1 20329_t:CDS:2 [Funneliformis geosporum]
MTTERNVILITGGNGFIGSHVAKYLHEKGNYVRVVDLCDDSTFRLCKDTAEFCSEFIEGDIRSLETCHKLFDNNDVKWVFHFAANMGGMGVIHSKNNFAIYKENHSMSLNILEASMKSNIDKFFYASTACVYSNNKQSNINNDIKLRESDTWNCISKDSKAQELYGAEKLNTEIILSSLVDSLENKNSSQKFPQFKIARFHNVYGEGGAWYGGREKAPAALLRKAIFSSIYARENEIEIWGNGKQRRSFLYIEDCVEAIIKLMECDLEITLNIGSEESISIEELAYVAFETIDVSRDSVNLCFDTEKPVGVNNRNSDNSLIQRYLNWSPKHSIREGMIKTSSWIRQEIVKKKLQYENDPRWHEFIKSSLKSQVNVLTFHNEIITFGVLLPITSRGLINPEDCLENLRKFAKSLLKTSRLDVTDQNYETKYQIKIYIGIDENDNLFHPIENNLAENFFREYGFTNIHTKAFDFPPGSICAIWRELAHQAYHDKCDYFVLFGDDVIIETDGWMNKFHKAYREISIQKKVPCGFGCITFADITFPGFPTFPVIGRIHLDIFNGDMFPRERFQNQDGDPYLFQTYRRWGCSVMLHDVKIQNFVGGSQAPRYERKHHPEWSFDMLDKSVDTVEKWLKANCKTPVPKLLTLDIVIPSFRVDLKFLDPIINVERPPTMSTSIVIIIDNPNTPNTNILKKLYEKDPFIRIREHKTNLGASLSRNRGLKESNADYVLFLDDDVLPEKNILFECEKIIKKYPTACGFIGNSKFPPANYAIFTSALVLSCITFFWDIAEKLSDDIPWGVTANLLIRRYKDNVLFDPIFPKTGGGEDIDFCLKKRNFFINHVENGIGFKAAPNVKVIHPWWNDGKRSYIRFFYWAKGDGALVNMYPDLTYNDILPNSAELLLGSILIFLITIIVSLIFAVFNNTAIINFFVIWTFLSIPLIIVSIMIVDIYLSFAEPCGVSTVDGYRFIIAAAESSIIRLMSQCGRLEGIIERKEWKCIGKRFEWFVKRCGNKPIHDEINRNLMKFSIWIGLMMLSLSLLVY